MSERTIGADADATPGTIARTRAAIGVALGRRDARVVLGGVTVGYLIAYLFAVQHATLAGRGGIDVIVARDPLSLLFQRTGPLQFEPMALIVVGPVSVQLAPLTLLIGSVLAGLVGLNLALSYLAYRQPTACGIAAGAGPLAALPGLFSGAACCGPALLFVVGLQATGLVLTVFSVLVPIAMVLLVGSLLWVGRTVDPTALESATATAASAGSKA